MTEALKVVTLINIMFIALLMLSGSLGTLAGEVAYYIAFVVPVLIGFYAAKDLQYKREEIAGIAEKPDRLMSLDCKRVGTLIPLVTPVVAIVFLVSVITSLLLSLIGIESAPIEDSGIVSMLLAHALVPAIFEEALFRYIPMKLLLHYSRRWCVLYSAFCFALIHCSFVQMPYAFVAGAIFMSVDVAFGSVWPSVILHTDYRSSVV